VFPLEIRCPHPPRLPYIFLLSSVVSHSSLSSSIFFTLSSPWFLAGEETERRPTGAGAIGQGTRGPRERARRGTHGLVACSGRREARRLRRPAACGQGRSSWCAVRCKTLLIFSSNILCCESCPRMWNRTCVMFWIFCVNEIKLVLCKSCVNWFVWVWKIL
jgi:hypothetical protein